MKVGKMLHQESIALLILQPWGYLLGLFLHQRLPYLWCLFSPASRQPTGRSIYTILLHTIHSVTEQLNLLTDHYYSCFESMLKRTMNDIYSQCYMLIVQPYIYPPSFVLILYGWEPRSLDMLVFKLAFDVLMKHTCVLSQLNSRLFILRATQWSVWLTRRQHMTNAPSFEHLKWDIVYGGSTKPKQIQKEIGSWKVKVIINGINVEITDGGRIKIVHTNCLQHRYQIHCDEAPTCENKNTGRQNPLEVEHIISGPGDGSLYPAPDRY